MLQIFWSQVGQRSFKLIPNEFVRVEFRSISREEVGVNSEMATQEGLNPFGAVSPASIPEENERTSNVPGQGRQELADLKGADIFVGMEPDIQGQALLFGRNRNSGDGRDLRPVSSHAHDRCLSPGRPGSDDVGNQKEAAFIEKYQGSLEPLSLFLYAATLAVSTVEWPSRFSPGPFSPVSGSSIPSLEADAKHGWDDKEHETSFESPGQCALASTNLWNAPRPKGLEPAPSPVFAFGLDSASPDVQNSDENVNLPNPGSGKLLPIVKPNSDGRRLDDPRLTDWTVSLADEEPVADALPAAAGIVEVSCI